MSPSRPLAPRNVEETGIRRSLLEELVLKTVFFEGDLSLVDLGRRLGLSLPVVDELFQSLRKAQLLEVTGMAIGTHRVAVSSAGRSRAQELLQRSSYAGPAPVALQEYSRRVRRQAAVTVRAAAVRQAFAPLVLSEEFVRQLGVAMTSGAAMVLHGPTGTGKTAVAELIPDVFDGDGVWLPHAVEVDGQIITVYDPHVHASLDRRAEPESILAAEQDGRWVLCERPRIIAGGELTIEMLDLQYHPTTGYYAAPLQMQANNGVLIIDDFGRQRMRPDELLNRWIVALDRRLDFLTLQGGKKFDIPFELLVVFSTNIDPRSGSSVAGRNALVDDAFLRRIPNKIPLGFSSVEDFAEIFRRVCEAEEVEYDPDLVGPLVTHIQQVHGEPLRACLPRDLVRQVLWEAKYEEREPEVTWEALERACQTYFLDGGSRSPRVERKVS